MTLDSIPFPSCNHPSRNHPRGSRPFDPPSRINFENNNLASLTLLFHLFSIPPSVWFSLFRLPLRHLMCFGFSSLLFFHSVMVLMSEIREILLRLFASRILVPSSLLSMKHEKERKREKRMKERSIKKEKGQREILADSLQVSGEQGVSTRMHRIVLYVLERPYFARTSYVWE